MKKGDINATKFLNIVAILSLLNCWNPLFYSLLTNYRNSHSLSLQQFGVGIGKLSYTINDF